MATELTPQNMQMPCSVSYGDMELQDIQSTAPISSIEIGIQASKKGNFQLARQMLHSALEQLDNHDDKQPRLVELITFIADTYLNEGNYDLAKQWYMKALKRCEILQGMNTLPAACLMAKLAQLHVLQSNMSEFKKYFESVQHIYLLTLEENISVLLDPLTDLSWALCIKKHIEEVQPVNKLIVQIKQLEEENKLEIVA